MRKSILAGLLFFILLYSCSPQTAQIKPNIKLPEVKNKSELIINGKWWKQFKDKNLIKLIKEGMKNNSDILLAFEKIKQLKAEYGIAKAQLFPSIEINSSATRSQEPKKLNPLAKPMNTYNINGSINLNIDLFGKLNNARKSQLYQLLAQKYYAQQVKLNLIYSIASLYFDMCTYKEIEKIYSKIIKNDLTMAKIVESQYKLGLVSYDEVNQAKINLLSDNSTLTSIKNTIESDKANLLFLIGKQPKGIFNSNLTCNNLPNPIKIPPFLPSYVIKKRPDIKMAMSQLKASEFNLKSTKAELLPSINLTAEGGYESNQFRKWIVPNTRLWSIFLNALMPIFEFGRISGQIKEAESLRKQALINYVKTVKNAFKEIYIDIHTLSNLKTQLNSLKNLTMDSYSSYKILKNKYKNGIENRFDVLNSQNNYLKSKVELIKTQSNYLKVEASLYKDLGGGW